MIQKINEKNYLTLDENAQYFECGYSCDNAVLIKLGNEKIFITDGRYTLEARQNTQNIQIVETNDLFVQTCDFLNKTSIKEIIYDPDKLSISQFKRLESLLKEKIKLIGVPNFHQKIRILKTKKQINLIKKSQKLNKEAYEKFAKFLNKSGKGMSEAQLDYQARIFLSYQGKYDLSFSPILGVNANAAKPHALPSQKDILSYKDLLLFDAGIKYKRYCSDRTRTAYFDSNGINFKKKQTFRNKKLQKIYDTVLKAQEKTIMNLRAGMSGKEIDKIARDVIQEAGFGEYFMHSTGHGIGLDIHELPFISKRSETTIEDGMVFSIEPGIYIPDHYGVRIEDLVVVENGRAKVL